MRLSRKNRLIIALHTLFSLLFMQLAVSAHACQGVSAGRLNDGIKSVAFADGQGCQKPDPAPSNVCKVHCEKSSLSVDSQAHATPDAPVLPLLAIGSRLDAHLSTVGSFQGALFAGIPTTPPSLRFCVLRI